jgi:hypothetical protein
VLVHVRRVEKVDACLDATVHELRRARLIERFAEGHRSETKSRNFQIGMLQLYVWDHHGFL